MSYKPSADRLDGDAMLWLIEAIMKLFGGQSNGK